MNILFAIVGVLGAAATTILVSATDLGGWMKVVIVVPMVMLAVYSMARIPPGEPEAEESTCKSPVAEAFE